MTEHWNKSKHQFAKTLARQLTPEVSSTVGLASGEVRATLTEASWHTHGKSLEEIKKMQTLVAQGTSSESWTSFPIFFFLTQTDDKKKIRQLKT